MNQSVPSQFLRKFAATLKERSFLPKSIDIATIGPVVWASIYNSLGSKIITESVFTGMDVECDVAVLKGLVEMIERHAFRRGYASGLASCQTKRSDGFAAFPYGIVKDTENVARSNAYNEAVERFVWATWWDNTDYGHKLENVSSDDHDGTLALLFREIKKVVPMSSIYRVQPFVANGGPLCVVIYFAFLKPFGVISGGACGPADNISGTNFRAVCELVRHALGIKRMKTNNIAPETFYEKRLAFFGQTNEGEDIVKERLNTFGTKGVVLPQLVIDSQVPHDLRDLVLVHRCYFQDQPPFVDGKLERLCL